MLVRNKLYKVTEWEGRWTDASDAQCPCYNCYHPHDFGHSTQTTGHKIEMRCLTREQGWCPTMKPMARHVYTKHGKVCKRCGHHKQTERKQ